jgi:hypothetical protein
MRVFSEVAIALDTRTEKSTPRRTEDFYCGMLPVFICKRTVAFAERRLNNNSLLLFSSNADGPGQYLASPDCRLGPEANLGERPV